MLVKVDKGGEINKVYSNGIDGNATNDKDPINKSDSIASDSVIE